MWARVWTLFLRHRKRVAPLALLLALWLLGDGILGGVPRETEIRYGLGPHHAQVREATVLYVRGEDAVKGARFTYAAGAPASFDHTVELPPGQYVVTVELVLGQKRTTVRRRLSVPADGIVRIDLGPEVAATGLGRIALTLPRRHT